MKALFFLIFSFVISNANTIAQTPSPETFVCLPCGNDCDLEAYDKPGKCRYCGMDLVKKPTQEFRNIQPAELCKYIAAHPGIVLLDVRSKREFEGKSSPDYGTLKNAINIPINELENRYAELDPYKNKEIIIYCSHSKRSSQASYLLTQKGFSKIINMAGGLSVLKDNSCKK